MKLFYDKDKKANYDSIDETTTVKDLLEAIDIFLGENPLPCNNCEESCCKKSWSVEMDNICVNRLCIWDTKAAVKFTKDKLVKKKNYYREFNQFVVKKEKECPFITEDNLCTIYEQRPVICRLYICCDKSYRYNVLRELIGSTYLRALILEDRINNNNFTQRTINNYRKNPAVFAKDYDILLSDIIRYSEYEGWLDEDEKQDLYKLYE